MGIMPIIQRLFPNLSQYLTQRIKSLHEPRFMIVGDIDHWVSLRKQINAKTGRINSYRDIRKITAAESRTVPSLGTLRNYLGEGGELRREIAKADWLAWFEDFGGTMAMNKDEVLDFTSEEDWLLFRVEYNMFLGY